MPAPDHTDDRFWLLAGDVPAGPFTPAQVHAELAAGRASWQTLACRIGGTAWLPVVRTPGLGPGRPNRWRATGAGAKWGGAEPMVEAVPPGETGPAPFRDDGTAVPTPRQFRPYLRAHGADKAAVLLRRARQW